MSVCVLTKKQDQVNSGRYKEQPKTVITYDSQAKESFKELVIIFWAARFKGVWTWPDLEFQFATSVPTPRENTVESGTKMSRYIET